MDNFRTQFKKYCLKNRSVNKYDNVYYRIDFILEILKNKGVYKQQCFDEFIKQYENCPFKLEMLATPVIELLLNLIKIYNKTNSLFETEKAFNNFVNEQSSNIVEHQIAFNWFYRHFYKGMKRANRRYNII